MACSDFTITREDWSLHRQGQMDQWRHMEKVNEALKNHLSDIVSDESIISGTDRYIITVPIRSLNEYRFRYNWDKLQRVGQGTGDSKEGQIVAHESSVARKGPGKTQGGGDRLGEDFYEVGITIDELGGLIFDGLELPNLDSKKQPNLTTRTYEWQDVRKAGLLSNIDKKRTIMEALKRNILSGKPPLKRFQPDDLRFKVWEEQYTPQTSAVVLAMMDTSGSMGEFEKYIARSFFFWMIRFLRTKYDNVNIHFLAHSTEAKEVTEEEFFTKGESGGTRCSSVYQLALKLVSDRYPPSFYNLYPFHFSDGDNLTSDNRYAVESVRKLLEVCTVFGYGEIDAAAGGPTYYRSGTLASLYQQEIEDPRFLSITIKDKSGVYPALRTFFGSPSPTNM